MKTKAVIYFIESDKVIALDIYLVKDGEEQKTDSYHIMDSYFIENDEVLRILLDDIKPDIVEDLR